MNITFILNGEDQTISTDAEQRLIDILRNHFQLLGAKSGCLSGRCGICSVMLNGEVVKSCLVPAFMIHGCEIITIEGFSQTDEYRDIISGFSEAGVQSCGYCDAGKILATEALLSKTAQPGRTAILPAFRGIKCRCTDPESLIEGVVKTVEKRQRRLYGIRNIS